MKNLDFTDFNTGTLFLVRTPDVFPEGYAEESFSDMKNNLHFDYAALLETWNCDDGVLWISDKFPRSSYWMGEKRDPIEECFMAADKYDMAFLPEAGMMDKKYMESHPEGMCTDSKANIRRYGRIGLSPSCPYTIEYLIEKYDTMLAKFGHHPSCRGICMPCENSVRLTYDKYTLEHWKKTFGYDMPSEIELLTDKMLERKVMSFLENAFLEMYCKLASHLKQKYQLPLMHYPIDVVSNNSFFQPTNAMSQGNIAIMSKVKELDMLNLQLHPPLNPNPYFFKSETEYLMGNAGDKPCMADTHFYHEFNAGKLLDTTPKRIIDNILSTLTPYGISFFCYGFMRSELPLWKKELNPNAPVYRVYEEKNTIKARREMVLKAMKYVEQLRPMMSGTHHMSDVAVYYPESLNDDYILGSYSLEHMFGLHELLNAASIPIHFVKNIPGKGTGIKCLILNTVKDLDDQSVSNLKKYLEHGGKLVIVGKCSEKIQKLAGINIRPSEGEFVVSEESDDYKKCFIHLPESGRHYTELNGEAVLLYENGESAITETRNVLYLGISDAVDRFSYYRDFNFASWIRKYFTRMNLNSGVEYHNIYRGEQDWHQFVSADLFENEGKKLLLLRNYGVEERNGSIKWNIPEKYHITTAIADGKPFDYLPNCEIPEYEFFVALFAEKIPEI